MAQGATHMVVLRSRPAGGPLVLDDPVGAGGVVALRPAREVRWLTRTVLRGESPELRRALLTRRTRTLADVSGIAAMTQAGTALSIHPDAAGPAVSRLTTDGALLAAAFEAGREAVLLGYGAPVR
jgi:hypothetical protein